MKIHFLIFFTAVIFQLISCTNDTVTDPSPNNSNTIPRIKSISIVYQPECESILYIKDSLTLDSLIYFKSKDAFDYFKDRSDTIFRKKISIDKMVVLSNLFDSLKIDSLNNLNTSMKLCAITFDCQTHNLLRIATDNVKTYSFEQRCITYNADYVDAFKAFENKIFELQN